MCSILNLNCSFRRADYTLWTGNRLFPLSFSGTRWLDDTRVAERAIDIWKFLTIYVEKISAGPKSLRPKCSSYNMVERSVKDPLMLAKLHYFVRVAKILHPFLQSFQADSPMLPFMEQELIKIFRSLMENFVRPSKLTAESSLAALMDIDIDKDENLLACKNVSIGFAAKEQLSQVQNLSEAKLTEFKYQSLVCYKEILKKISGRIPPETLSFISNLSSINPRYIINHPNSTISRFERLLLYLSKRKIRSSTVCDSLLSQYKQLTKKLRTEAKEECLGFFSSGNRLDTFFMNVIGRNMEYFGKLKSRFFQVFITRQYKNWYILH